MRLRTFSNCWNWKFPMEFNYFASYSCDLSLQKQVATNHEIYGVIVLAYIVLGDLMQYLLRIYNRFLWQLIFSAATVSIGSNEIQFVQILSNSDAYTSLSFKHSISNCYDKYFCDQFVYQLSLSIAITINKTLKI